MADPTRDDIIDFIRRMPSPDRPETESEAAVRIADLLARPRETALQPWQREWLAGKSKAEIDKFDALLKLSDEEITDLKGAVKFARSVQTVGIVVKWTIITIAGAITGTALVVKNGQDIVKWIMGAPR